MSSEIGVLASALRSLDAQLAADDPRGDGALASASAVLRAFGLDAQPAAARALLEARRAMSRLGRLAAFKAGPHAPVDASGARLAVEAKPGRVFGAVTLAGRRLALSTLANCPRSKGGAEAFPDAPPEAWAVVEALVEEGWTPPRALNAGPTLADVAERIAAWQADAFGPVEMDSAALKLSDEADEVYGAVEGLGVAWALGESTDAAWADVAEEVADVLFLCVDMARAFGGPDALARAALAKLARNERRVWTQAADGRWSGSKGDE